MRNVHLSAVIASAFVLCLSACSGGDSPAPAPSTSPGTTQTGSDAGGGAAADTGAKPQSVCPAVIGKWLATLDPGAVVNIQGSQLPITGTVDFELTRDDGDLANIVDFTGTATIQMAGQTITQQIMPSKSPSGDPKDTTCDGGLHLRGQANVSPLGDILFNIDGTIDSSVTPATGQGTFTMKTANDDGGAATANGTLKMVKK
jgi:hypothetical protein